MNAMGLPAACTRRGPDGLHVDDAWLAMGWFRAATGGLLSNQTDERILEVRGHVRALLEGRRAADGAADAELLARWSTCRPCPCHPDGEQLVVRP